MVQTYGPCGEAKDRGYAGQRILRDECKRYFKFPQVWEIFRFKVQKNTQSRVPTWKPVKIKVVWWETQRRQRTHYQPVQPKAIQKTRKLASITHY